MSQWELTSGNSLSRRQLLQRSGMGLGSLAVAECLGVRGVQAEIASQSPLAARAPHFAPKAKHIIHLFMNGGPSHVDTFDPKPSLDKYHGTELPMKNLRTERKTGAAFRSPYKFRQFGESGI
ncbi:MAG: DUF1501 domain-containing protein, partial [Planctomycetales bacterium]|nr:DUF1501 domain-containing protein [Planctomycetales bacterium]